MVINNPSEKESGRQSSNERSNQSKSNRDSGDLKKGQKRDFDEDAGDYGDDKI